MWVGMLDISFPPSQAEAEFLFISSAGAIWMAINSIWPLYLFLNCWSSYTLDDFLHITFILWYPYRRWIHFRLSSPSFVFFYHTIPELQLNTETLTLRLKHIWQTRQMEECCRKVVVLPWRRQLPSGQEISENTYYVFLDKTYMTSKINIV